MRLKFKTIVALTTLAALSTSESASAACATCSTWGLQLTQQATLVQSLSQQLIMAQQEIQQLQIARQNIAALANNPTGSLTGTVNQLVSIAQTGTQLSFAASNVAGQFQTLYPGYQPGQGGYAQQYQNWRNTTMANINNELQGAGFQANSLANEAQILNQVTSSSQTAAGRMQVLQAGNQISGMMVSQMQNLRVLMMNQQQSQAAYQAGKVSAENAANQQSQNSVNSFVNGSFTSTGNTPLPSQFPNYH